MRRPAAAPLALLLLVLALCCSGGVAGSSSGPGRRLASLLGEWETSLGRGLRSLLGTKPAAAAAAPGGGRGVLRNPDKPALTKYGGVTMEQMVPDGYPLENHKVYTPDGWVLNMYRIPHGKYRNNKPGQRPVVLLHHGITLSSGCFTLFNANESIAYILADAGFDVWMANTRSNTFSRGNYKHSFRDPEYWIHSFGEYGKIDAKYQVDKALEVSGAKKLAFIGHSQGSTVGYVLLAAFPEMNPKISVMVHMGPVVFLDFFRAPFLKAMAEVRNDEVFRLARLGEFLWYRFLAPYVGTCKDNYWAELCVASLNLMFYGPSSFITPDDFVIIGQTWPCSVSSRNVAHWAQMMNDDQLRFQDYDHSTNCTNVDNPFEESCNQLSYGSDRPPEFDLSLITTPQVILEGEQDLMSTPEDIAEQRRRLQPGTFVTDIIYSQYSHMDFVWDRNARHATDMVDIMYRFSAGSF